MKKIIILLLAALMLLAVSCKKDKSEEVISNYLEFVKNYKIGMTTAYPGDLGKGDGKLEPAKMDTDFLEEILTALDSESKIKVTEISKESTGYWQSIENGDDFGADCKDIVIKYTYTEGESTVPKNGELSISGNIRIEKDSEVQKVTCTLKINNKDYNFSASVNSETEKFTSATVNGKDVEVRLLNSSPSR